MNKICQAYITAESHLLKKQLSEAITQCRIGIEWSEKENNFQKWLIGQRKLLILLKLQMEQHDKKGAIQESKQVIQEMEAIKLRLLDGQGVDWMTALSRFC